MTDTVDSDARSLRRRYARFNEYRFAPFVKGAVGFGFIALLPALLPVSVAGFSLGDVFSIRFLVVTMIYATAAQAWNIMSGYTGYFSFGHATFFGIGAYGTMVLLVDFAMNPWIGMLAGALVAVCVGLLIGYLTFNYELKGHYFALATLAFAVMFQAIVQNMQEFKGSLGFYKPFPRTYASGPGLVAFQWTDPLPYFYLILVFLVVVTVVAWGIKKSAIGLYLFAIKENEDAAQSLGIPVYRYKMFAVAVSAFFTACTGAFWSMYFNTINPGTVFAITKNVEILIPAVFGGMGTVAGPVLGAFIVRPFSEVIRQTFGGISGLDRIVYGLAIIFIVLYSPRGILFWPERVDDFRGWLARNYGIGSATIEGEHE